MVDFFFNLVILGWEIDENIRDVLDGGWGDWWGWGGIMLGEIWMRFIMEWDDRWWMEGEFGKF
jgi:hypothetical protein